MNRPSIIREKWLQTRTWKVEMTLLDAGNRYYAIVDVQRDNAGEYQLHVREVRRLSFWCELFGKSLASDDQDNREQLRELIQARFDDHESFLVRALISACERSAEEILNVTVA